jgi:hypothetical protein
MNRISKKRADEVDSLNRDLIAASDDYGFEVDFNAGALGVEFEDPPGKFVISPTRRCGRFGFQPTARATSWIGTSSKTVRARGIGRHVEGSAGEGHQQAPGEDVNLRPVSAFKGSGLRRRLSGVQGAVTP